MFGNLFNLVGDVARIAIAPVAVVADVARVVTKPASDLVVEVATEISDSVKSAID